MPKRQLKTGRNVPDQVGVPPNRIVVITNDDQYDHLPPILIESLKGKFQREWLVEHAYHCLPLVVGSQYGFIVKSLYDFWADFNVADTPRPLATDVSAVTVGGTTDGADEYNIVADFTTYFAVRTTDTRNGADDIYTQRTSATWQFDGRGDVVGAGPTSFGTWTLTGSGNTGSASSSIIVSGARVPTTTGTPLNDLFATEAWSTVT